MAASNTMIFSFLIEKGETKFYDYCLNEDVANQHFETEWIF